MSNLITPKASPEPGLLGVMSNDAYDASQAAQEQQQKKPMLQFVTALGSHIRSELSLAYKAKQPHQQKMAENIRQRKGRYSEDALKAIKQVDGADVFIRLTDVKCRAAEAWIKDILSSQSKPWLLEPTPVPNLSKQQEEAMLIQAQQEIQQLGLPPDSMQQLLEDARVRIKKSMEESAKLSTERMTELIDDQLKEGGFRGAFKDFIYDVITHKAGIMKGPVITRSPKLAWENGSLSVKDGISLNVQRISPFDVFPGAYATNIDDGPLMIRHRLTYSDLYKMLGLRGNKDDAIKRILSLHGTGGYTSWYEHIDSEREQLEGRQFYSGESNLFEAIEYRGPASGKDLLEWGIPENRIDDPLRSYEVEAWLIGHEVIRCVLNPDPLGRKPFYKASAVDQPGAWWGEGIPELIGDIQEICNYVIRALAENVSIASGPQVGIDPMAVPPGESITNIFSWKIWQLTQNGNSSGLPITFFQPSMHGSQLLEIYERFSRYADDVTGIPAYAYGSDTGAGAAKTASGLSMLMGSAARGIKAIMENIDEAVSKLVERYYVHNMMFSDDQSVKGDAQVVAQGSKALVQKETQQIRNMEMLQFTGNPIDMQIIGIEGRAEMLREAFSTMSYKRDIVPDHEELQERLMQQQQADEQALAEENQEAGAQQPQNQDEAGNPVGKIGNIV